MPRYFRRWGRGCISLHSEPEAHLEEEKETKEKLAMEMKAQGTSETDKEEKEERDRLSELPDCVALHIMNFMQAKYAVQTCVLSKRWKDLWKGLTTLSFSGKSFETIANYDKFVSRVLSSRDGSISLLNLDFGVYGSSAPKLLNTVMEYDALHNVQKLSICFCQSLTSFVLCTYSHVSELKFPKSLQLPALKSLHLSGISFTANANDCAEPFSTCYKLKTLVLQFCLLDSDAKVLCICNSNLSSLDLDHTLRATTKVDTSQLKIVLSTPNLTTLTIIDYVGFSYHQLSSESNPSCLEEGTIHTTANVYYSVIINWLQLLTDVKTLTLNSGIFKIILNETTKLAATRTQPPCFDRLESLKVVMDPFARISDEELNRTVNYYFQNSPLTKDGVLLSDLSTDKSCFDKLLNALSLFLA